MEVHRIQFLINQKHPSPCSNHNRNKVKAIKPDVTRGFTPKK